MQQRTLAAMPVKALHKALQQTRSDCASCVKPMTHTAEEERKIASTMVAAEEEQRGFAKHRLT